MLDMSSYNRPQANPVQVGLYAPQGPTPDASPLQQPREVTPQQAQQKALAEFIQRTSQNILHAALPEVVNQAAQTVRESLFTQVRDAIQPVLQDLNERLNGIEAMSGQAFPFTVSEQRIIQLHREGLLTTTQAQAELNIAVAVVPIAKPVAKATPAVVAPVVAAPKKAKEAKAVTAPAPTPGKRGPGRPKGSKNKPKTEDIPAEALSALE
jgi:hypothetical protein